MSVSDDLCAELLSVAVSDLDKVGVTYSPELVSELGALLSNELLGSPKPAEFRDMTQRLGKASRGKS